MGTAVAVHQEPKVVTFYSWMGSDGKNPGRHYPSSQIIHISGGESYRTAEGSKAKVPVKEARFHNGVCQASDPEIIQGVRKIMRDCAARGQSSGITEDIEEFYAMTMMPDQRARRATALAAQQSTQINDLQTENSRLRKLLEQQGQKPTIHRQVRKDPQPVES